MWHEAGALRLLGPGGLVIEMPDSGMSQCGIAETSDEKGHGKKEPEGNKQPDTRPVVALPSKEDHVGAASGDHSRDGHQNPESPAHFFHDIQYRQVR